MVGVYDWDIYVTGLKVKILIDRNSIWIIIVAKLIPITGAMTSTNKTRVNHTEAEAELGGLS
jgi:hypothetical protein